MAATPTNDWTPLTMYYPGGGYGLPNGVGRGYTQPLGPGTAVLPALISDPSSSISPFSSAPISEFSGVFFFGCGHTCDECLVIREYDYTVGSSVALVCCVLCTYINSTIYPFEAFYNPVTHPVTFP